MQAFIYIQCFHNSCDISGLGLGVTLPYTKVVVCSTDSLVPSSAPKGTPSPQNGSQKITFKTTAKTVKDIGLYGYYGEFIASHHRATQGAINKPLRQPPPPSKKRGAHNPQYLYRKLRPSCARYNVGLYRQSMSTYHRPIQYSTLGHPFSPKVGTPKIKFKTDAKTSTT